MNNESINYMEELDEFVNQYHINKEKICLVGSAVLALTGIRTNKDLDIMLEASEVKKIEKLLTKKKSFYEHIPISEHIDFFSNKYAVIGISDKELFKKHLFFNVNNYKIITLEIEYFYKKYRRKDKDILDINKIERLGIIDWNYVKCLGKNKCRILKSQLYKIVIFVEKIEKKVKECFFRIN